VQELSLELGRKARLVTALFISTGAISVGMHLRGATAWPAINDWNIGPPDINTSPKRVWSWRDPQFLKGMGWWTGYRTMVTEAPSANGDALIVRVDRPLTSFRQLLTSLIKELTLHPAEEVRIPVWVANPGSEAWASQGQYPVTVSYKWFAAAGMLPAEGERTALPKAVAPDHYVEVQVRVVAPAQPGEYFLRITLVQESVAWFMLKSNSFLQVPVTVR
jgi:hypothetical protein